MVVEQIWKHKVTYHPESIIDKSKSNYLDIRVSLPETIKKLDLWKGDHIKIERKSENDLKYLICEKHEGDTSNDDVYQIHDVKDSTPRMTISPWKDYFIDYDGDELLIIEVNDIDKNFRVYKNEDYNKHRIGELNNEEDTTPLVGKPVILPISAGVIHAQGGDGTEEKEENNSWTIKEATNSNQIDDLDNS